MREMKALVFEDVGIPIIKNRPVPEIKDDEVLVKVKAVGICKTDKEILWGKHPASTKIKEGFSLVPGHEWSGEVVKVGKNCKKISIGDRVVAETSIFCGKCKYCRSNQTNLCDNLVEIGIDRDGAMAEFISVPEKVVHKIPDSLSFEEAALIEPTAVAIHAVKRALKYNNKKSSVYKNSCILVFGDGPIGQLVAQVSKLILKPRKICMVGKSKIKLDIARKICCDICINITGHHGKAAVEIIKKRLNEYNLDPILVFEAVGSEEVVSETIDIVSKGGTIVYLGIENYASIDMKNIVFKELNILGSLSSPNVWNDAIKYVAKGQIKVHELITKRISLDEAVEYIKNKNQDTENIKTIIIL